LSTQNFHQWPIIKTYTIQVHETHIWALKLPYDLHTLNFNKLHQFQEERRFIIKKILAAYLNQTPNEINLQTSSAGKPFLPQNDLHFNISHTRNYLFIALNLYNSIGIDAEYLKPRNIKLFSERFWGGSWYEKSLSYYPHYLKTIGFYKAWTQTEAWVKAKGETIFNHSSFNPTAFPFSEKIEHENFAFVSFMPYVNLISSICINKNNLTIYQKSVDLSTMTSYQSIFGDKDF